VQRTGNARALQRLAGGKLPADRHQARHFVFGNTDSPAVPVGKREVGSEIVGGRRIEYGVHRALLSVHKKENVSAVEKKRPELAGEPSQRSSEPRKHTTLGSGLLEKAERGKLVCPFDKLRLFHADIGGLSAFKTGGQARKSPVIREGGTDYGHKLLDGRLKCHKRAIEGKYSACLALFLEVVGDVPVQLELNQSCM